MDVSCVVPARLNSSRFPGKALVHLQGIPMVVRVLQQAQKANCFQNILCATDSPEIAAVVMQNGFLVEMTSSAHASGTDRVAEVAQKLELEKIVNLQGDEPIMDIETIQLVAQSLSSNPNHWITAATPLRKSFYKNTDVVKVQCNAKQFATDFSRELDLPDSSWYHHRGIYAYTHITLQRFVNQSPSTQELQRNIEPLRILSHTPIQVIMGKDYPPGIDSPADIPEVLEFLDLNHHAKGCTQ